MRSVHCGVMRILAWSLKDDLALVSPHDGSLPDCAKKEEELRCVG